MLSRLLLLDGLSVDDVLLWPAPQEGVTMFSRSVSAAEGLRWMKVVVGDTGLISTVSATEMLRSVQRGWDAMLARLSLLLWFHSISVIFGVGFEGLWLLLLVEASLSGRRMQSLYENLRKLLRWGLAFNSWLQRSPEDRDECCFLRMARSWRRAGMEATAIPMFCSRLQ